MQRWKKTKELGNSSELLFASKTSHTFNGLQQNKVFEGKYGAYENRTVIKTKEDGTETGAIVSYSKSNTVKKEKQNLFLEKVILEPVKEKIYLDIARYFANAASSRLELLTTNETQEICSRFEYARNKDLASCMSAHESQGVIMQLIQRDINTSPKIDGKHLLFLSKFVKNYADLGACIAVTKDGKEFGFNEFMEKFGRPPEYIKHPLKQDLILPLYGLMAIAANSKITGDIDWLGGSSKNTGAVIVTKHEDAYALAVNVDAGFSVLENPEPIRDIQCASMGAENIMLNALSQKQYDEFMHSLYLIVHRYPEEEQDKFDSLLNFLVWRNGSFNPPTFSNKVLSQDESKAIMTKIKNNISALKEIYRDELSAYHKQNKSKLEADLVRERMRDQSCLKPIAPENGGWTQHCCSRFFTYTVAAVATAATVVTGIYAVTMS
jgi:hypothetical protein